MPIPWLTVLRSVPWSNVIGNAPKVADGARKLWNAIGRKPPPAESAGSPSKTAAEQTVATLHARVAALETTTAELHAQLLASSELLKTLAEENAQIVRQAERLRVRLRWMLAGLIVVGAAALAAWLRLAG